MQKKRERRNGILSLCSSRHVSGVPWHVKVISSYWHGPIARSKSSPFLIFIEGSEGGRENVEIAAFPLSRKPRGTGMKRGATLLDKKRTDDESKTVFATPRCDAFIYRYVSCTETLRGIKFSQNWILRLSSPFLPTPQSSKGKKKTTTSKSWIEKGIKNR